MRKMKIFTDSASDLPKDLAKQYGHRSAPAVRHARRRYPSRRRITDIQKICSNSSIKTGILPKTAAVNVADIHRMLSNRCWIKAMISWSR